MPTLPLFVPPESRSAGASPDAWHRVTAPGGYEWWHFDAEDAVDDLRLVAGLYDGFPFHPGYLRAHARYLRRPTRVAPAVPSQYPVVSFAVYERNRVAARFTTQHPPGAFEASDERPQVRVGGNAFRSADAGDAALHLVIDRPGTAADLTFRPLTPAPPAGGHRIRSRAAAGAGHVWLVSHATCEVEGTVRLGGGTAGGRTIAFRGRGYHDHRYGTGPLGAGLRRWIRGQLLLDGLVIAFEVAQPAGGGRPAEAKLLTGDAAGWHDAGAVELSSTGSRRTGAGLSYPERLRFGDLLDLENPRVIDASPAGVRLTYAASSRGGTGTALCEVWYPQRLRWPVLGRVIEKSIRHA